MTDQVGVCNQALLLLGERVIQAIDEDTTEALACATFYEDAKEHCLRDLKPNFAKARSDVLTLVNAPTFDWTYAAQLPDDCLLVISIERDELVSATARGPRGAREWRVEGRTILSNRAEMRIEYIKSTADTEMDASFVKALAAYLASELAYPLTNSTTKSQEMLALYGMRADDGQATWGQESSTVRTENDQLTIVR